MRNTSTYIRQFFALKVPKCEIFDRSDIIFKP